MSTVFVTGATGFIGRALCRWLTDHGHQVIAGVRHQPTAPLAAAATIHHYGDLTQLPPLTSALATVDAVVHLAAHPHSQAPAQFATDAAAWQQRIHVAVTRHVAEQAALAGVNRFIFLSTIKVHGETTRGRSPFVATDPPAPADAYARAKYAAEQALLATAAATGLVTVILRPPLVYGAGATGNMLRLARWVQRGIPLPVAAVTNQRSLIGVTNLCALIGHCLAHPAAANQQFVVTDHPPLSTPELIRAIATAARRPARMTAVPVPLLRGLGYLSGQSALISRLCDSLAVDASRLQRQLNWQPPITLDEELTALITGIPVNSSACDPPPASF